MKMAVQRLSIVQAMASQCLVHNAIRQGVRWSIFDSKRSGMGGDACNMATQEATGRLESVDQNPKNSSLEISDILWRGALARKSYVAKLQVSLVSM